MESIVVVGFHDPGQLHGRPISRGLAGVMLFRPPLEMPVFRLRTPPPTRDWETRAQLDVDTIKSLDALLLALDEEEAS